MSSDNLIGKTINGYRIDTVIGHGGMATVYQANQVSMNRLVALKVLPQQYVNDDTYLQRFHREVKIVSQLEHRNIIPVYDYGEFERQPYIVMRYMGAGSIDDLLAKGAVSLERAAEIIRQVAPALDYAHNKSVLHRDLKPSNVLLDDDGGAYLTDFGIARILGEARGSTITTQGVVGTPAYMSPEQAQGKPLDNRSDIYSLGVMLFEMVTGKRPFESDTPYGVAVMQVTTPPPQPSAINPVVPPHVESVIYTALSKAPNQRYGTATALSEALTVALRAEPSDKPDTQPRPIPELQRQVQNMPPPSAFARPAAYASPPNQRTPSEAMPARKRRKRRADTGPWMSIAIGGMIGCGLLAAVLVVALVFVSNLNDILDEDPLAVTEDTNTVEAGGIVTRQTRPDDASVTPGTILETEMAPPTNTSPPSTPTVLTTSTPSGPTNTPTRAPVGVRPDTGQAVPSGSLIYFAEVDGNYDLFRMDVVTEEVSRLTLGTRADQFPAVSPDGQRLAFTAVRNETPDLYVMNLDGSGLRRITNLDRAVRLPSWSPDGNWIVFSADTQQTGHDDLFMIRPDGSGLQRFYASDMRDSAPRWFGEQVVFSMGDPRDARTWELALLDVAESEVTLLTENQVRDALPAWSPDGQHVLYSSDGEGASAIVQQDLVGDGGVMLVYDGPGYDWGGTYSPDGQFIAFTSDMSGRDEIYLIRVDGEGLRQMTDAGGAYPVWVPGA